MTEEEVRQLAEHLYGDRRDAAGLPAIDHPRRVAERVSERSRAVAWLHDVFEDELLSWLELRKVGLSNLEQIVIMLLSRNSILYRDEDRRTYASYVQRIATFPSLEGDMAREVKLADIEDNMTRPCPPEMLDLRKSGGRYDRARAILEETSGE